MCAPCTRRPAAQPQDGDCVRPARARPSPDTPAAAAGSPCTGEGVYLYEDIDYGGACRKFTADDPEFGDEDGFHDKASSCKFVGFNYSNGRASATLYEHAYYSGASSTFNGDDPWLGDDAIGSDRADSIRIEIRPFCDLVIEPSKTECEALLAFYNSTFGPYWTDRTGWVVNYWPCSWYGVECDLESAGQVQWLLLPGNNLKGTIPSILGNLWGLERLDLSSNQLTGTIPESLMNVNSLLYINLSGNELTGDIPATLGNKPVLEGLDLSSNQLTGSIPATYDDQALLYYLVVDHNPQMSGALPQSLKNLALSSFYFDNTSLCEPPDAAFQAWLGSIPNLKRTGVLCSGATPTATLTRTRTPWPTLPGGVKRMHLPLLLRHHWSPRSQDCTELLTNGGFESGLSGWSSWGNVTTGAGRLSPVGAQLGGVNNAQGELWQSFFVPADAESVTWRFWWKAATSVTQPEDFLHVYTEVGDINLQYGLLRAQGALDQWQMVEVDLTQWAGRWVMTALQVETDASVPSTFRIDDASVLACARPE